MVTTETTISAIMPDISATVRELVLSYTQVTDLVDTRVYSDILPQGIAMPAVRYWVVSEDAHECLTAIVDLSTASIQFDCYALTRAEAVNLADTIRLALESYRGDVNGQAIRGISLTLGQTSGVDRSEAGTDQRRFFTSLEFAVPYQTTTTF